MKPEEFQKHLDATSRHEGVLWDSGDDDDEIRSKLRAIQDRLERATASCFADRTSLYSLLTRKLF